MTPAPPPIDIRPADWAIVQGILQQHLLQAEVWAFGSRVTGRAKHFSGLDLAIIADQPFPLSARAALAEAFTESDLPWTVDVVDWVTTSAVFRQIIEGDKVVLQRPHRT